MLVFVLYCIDYDSYCAVDGRSSQKILHQQWLVNFIIYFVVPCGSKHQWLLCVCHAMCVIMMFVCVCLICVLLFVVIVHA